MCLIWYGTCTYLKFVRLWRPDCLTIQCNFNINPVKQICIIVISAFYSPSSTQSCLFFIHVILKWLTYGFWGSLVCLFVNLKWWVCLNCIRLVQQLKCGEIDPINELSYQIITRIMGNFLCRTQLLNHSLRNIDISFYTYVFFC